MKATNARATYQGRAKKIRASSLTADAKKIKMAVANEQFEHTMTNAGISFQGDESVRAVQTAEVCAIPSLSNPDFSAL